MPPHCDSLDGPVVSAARRALDARDVNLVLAYVPADGEDEVRDAFQRVLPVRELGPRARDVADLAFFETVVRIHRAGEGAPYTGLKAAGLSVGPVIPLAEQAIDQHSADLLADFLSAQLRKELASRLQAVDRLAARRQQSLEDERRYVGAMLGFEVYSHHLYEALHAAHHTEEADHHSRLQAHAG
jgi:hypothetical protein